MMLIMMLLVMILPLPTIMTEVCISGMEGKLISMLYGILLCLLFLSLQRFAA